MKCKSVVLKAQVNAEKKLIYSLVKDSLHKN